MNAPALRRRPDAATTPCSSSTPPPSSRAVTDRPVKKLPTLRGRTVVNLFFEDSTRTRISFEAAAKRLSADVINFAAKGSSRLQGREPEGHRADPRGDGRRRRRHPARGVGRPPPARHGRLDRRLGRQRRRRHPRAPDPGAARRVHDAPPPARRAGRPRPGAASRSSATSCTAGSRAPTSSCCAPSAPRSPSSRRRRCCRSASSPGRARCRTTSTPVLPGVDAVMMLRVQRERMKAAFLPDARSTRGATASTRDRLALLPGPRHRHAPRPDEPRPGDRRRRRRLRRDR